MGEGRILSACDNHIGTLIGIDNEPGFHHIRLFAARDKFFVFVIALIDETDLFSVTDRFGDNTDIVKKLFVFGFLSVGEIHLRAEFPALGIAEGMEYPLDQFVTLFGGNEVGAVNRVAQHQHFTFVELSCDKIIAGTVFVIAADLISCLTENTDIGVECSPFNDR